MVYEINQFEFLNLAINMIISTYSYMHHVVSPIGENMFKLPTAWRVLACDASV
jgi:hypothetical protein